MADRNKILWGISDSDDRMFMSKMCDIAERSVFSHKAMFSRFLDPRQQNLVKSRLCADFEVSFFGGFDAAERTMAAFAGERGSLCRFEGEFPLCAVRIRPKGRERLSHRDYLGSLLALGIKREHIGDILVEEDAASVFMTREIADFVLMNLKRVASSPVRLSAIEDTGEISAARSFKQTDVTVPSLRADCVAAAAMGKPRSSAAAMIEEGLCLINYERVKSVSAAVKNGDVLSVRGYGKMIIETDGTFTKKGRIHIKVKRYI